MICRVAQSTRHSLTFVCLFVSTTGLAFAYLPIHDMVPIFLFTLLKRCNVNKYPCLEKLESHMRLLQGMVPY